MTVLRAIDLHKRFRRREVVRGVSLEVHSGEIVGLLGPNGAGKSTAFNMVAGLLPMDSGSVLLGEIALGRLPLYRRARLGLGYLPQDSTVFRGLSAEDNLMVALEAKKNGVDPRAHVGKVLRDFNLQHVSKNVGSQLSGGERRRVEMARTLINTPKIVLLDEPFAGVDPIAVAEIKGFIRSMRDAGIGVLLTDHNVRESLEICDRAYLISEGQILLSGTPETITGDPRAQEVYFGADFRF